MYQYERAEVEKILRQLDATGALDSGYRFAEDESGLKLLGVGGFSYVYEMYDVADPDRRYAAKIMGLGGRRLSDESVVSTIEAQSELASKSGCIQQIINWWIKRIKIDMECNLLRVVDYNDAQFVVAESLCVQIIVMEKLQCVIEKDIGFSPILTREELKTEAGVLRLAKDIGAALMTVHEHGYLHRDVKLENIFWDEVTQTYKLGDFGITKYVGDKGAETVVFTDGYGAPEIENRLVTSYDARADIYSFGITLFLLLNHLRFPEAKGYRAQVIQYAQGYNLPAPEGASKQLSRILINMCRYYPGERYQTVRDILRDIDQMDGNENEGAPVEIINGPTITYRDNKNSEEKVKIETAKSKRQIEKEVEEENRLRCRLYSVAAGSLMTLLFVLLYMTFSGDGMSGGVAHYMVLPAVIVAQAMFQRWKEFHVVGELASIGLCTYLIIGGDTMTPLLVTMIVVLSKMPTMIAGCGLGTFAWYILWESGRLRLLERFGRWELGLLAIILIVALLHINYLHRYYFEPKYRRDSKNDKCERINRDGE